MTLPDEEQMHGITKSELKILILEAAEKGSDRALARIGLHDENAVHDVKELRSLLEGWRETKSSIWRTIIRWVTMAVLGFIAFAVWSEFRSRL
ncbi:MAG TPA: hypothetical protein DCE52_11600 [Rhodobacteraceae bacterium]|jgi:hypothetical protein|nr:hypothetical protein [Paracoccaceae bacterium]